MCLHQSLFVDNNSAIQWRHNERHGISNHQPHGCLLNRLFRCRSKKIPKLRVTGLCVGNSPVTGEFPAQRANNAESVSIWWRHRGIYNCRGEPRNASRSDSRKWKHIFDHPVGVQLLGKTKGNDRNRRFWQWRSCIIRTETVMNWA